jgi:predicted CoA-binding protein
MSSPVDERLREILAYDIPLYLHQVGYDVHPVNPTANEIFGLPAYDTVGDVPERVDVVQVFRPEFEVVGIVEAALERGDVKAIWLQQGIRSYAAELRAEEADVAFVEDRCIGAEHRRLVG